jgi:hypothetical protein
MRTPLLALLVFCTMVMSFTSPSTSTAAISVIVDGSAISELCNSNTAVQFILSDCNGTGTGRSYTTFKIKSQNGTSPARVVATDNAGDEEIKVENALIEPVGSQPTNCNASNSNYVYCSNIIFSQLFSAGPSASGTTSVTYYRKANGLLWNNTGGGATLSTFRVHGWVQDVDVGVQNPIGSAQAKTASSTAYTFVDAGTPLPLFVQSLVFLPTSLSHERVLKGQFWFGFKQTNHQLKLNYITVYEPSGSGGDDAAHGQTVANDPSIVDEDGSSGSSGCIPCCRMCPGRPHAPHDPSSHDGEKKHDDDAKHKNK